MTRGKQKLYYDLIKNDDTPSVPRKRNHYQPERNKALATRYYYHLILRRRTYEDTLNDLINEFFISESTIIKLLGKDQPMAHLEKLIETKAKIKDLRAQYPQWSWKSLAQA